MATDIEELYSEMMEIAENDVEKVCISLLFECAAKVSELISLKRESFEKEGNELFVLLPNLESVEYQTSVEIELRKIKLDASRPYVEKMLENPEASFFTETVIEKLKQKGSTPDDVKEMRTKQLEEEGLTEDEIHKFLGHKIMKPDY